MNTLSSIIVLAAIVVVAQAHLTTICSSTDPKRPGEIDFFFGTYHGKNEMGTKGAPGTVTISQPNVPGGAKLSGSFNKFYGFSKNFVFKNVEGMKKEFIKVINDKNMLNDGCQFDCYVVNKQSQAMKAPSKGQWMVPQPHGSKNNDLQCQKSGAWTYLRAFSVLTIKGAKSGDWFLEITGTNDVYNPGQQQCSLSKNNPKWIGGMTVADGTPSCKGTPPVPSSIDQASVAGCKNMIGGAACSSWKCSGKNAKPEGTITCKGGKWEVSAKCMGESKCLNEAQKGIDAIKTAVSTCQATINGMSDGAHCINENKGTVAAAQKAADGAAKTAKDADAAVAKASSTKVNFNAIPLDQLVANEKNCAGLINKLKANSNWNAASAQHQAAAKAKINADAQKKATADALVNAKAAQKAAILKCQCKAKNAADSTFDKCQVNSKGQKTQWRKSHHLQCVEEASTTIGANGKAQGTCHIPAVPTVHPKKMAQHVKEAKCMGVKTMLQEDEEVEAAQMELPEIDAEPTMPGWHRMDDGSMMRDEDMQ